MPNYRIVNDEYLLDDFLSFLPKLENQEVFYLCLFARHKYCSSYPNTRDNGQVARVIARNKEELKQKIMRFEVPIGSYVRDGNIIPQEALAVYLSYNPRSLVKANKGLLIELAKRFSEGQLDFNPISIATTEIHRAVGTKHFLDFDFDDADPTEYLDRVKEILPDPESYRILKTRGGFHLLVRLSKVKTRKNNWYRSVIALPKCDVRGSDTLTPVPGCIQGGFTPYFI